MFSDLDILGINGIFYSIRYYSTVKKKLSRRLQQKLKLQVDWRIIAWKFLHSSKEKLFDLQLIFENLKFLNEIIR